MTAYLESTPGGEEELNGPAEQDQLAEFYGQQVADMTSRIQNYPEGEARLRAGAYLVLDYAFERAGTKPADEDARKEFEIRVAQAILPAAQQRYREAEHRRISAPAADSHVTVEANTPFRQPESAYDELHNLSVAGLDQDVYAVALEAFHHANY